MDKLKNTLVKASNNKSIPLYDKEIIEAILAFFKYKDRFYKLLNTKNYDELTELKQIGHTLDELEKKIINQIHEDKENKAIKNILKTSSFNEILHIYTIKLLPYTLSTNGDMVLALYNSTNSYDFFPERKNVVELFNMLEKIYSLWEEIYVENSDYGIVRYILLDKKMRKNMNSSIPLMYLSNELSLNDIVDMTSLESRLNSYNSKEQVSEIKKHKEKFIKKNSTVIQL